MQKVLGSGFGLGLGQLLDGCLQGPARGCIPGEGAKAKMNTWTRGRGLLPSPVFPGKLHRTYSSPSQTMGFGSDWINLPHPRVLEATTQAQGTLRLYGQHLHLQNTYYRAQMRPSGFHMHDK